MIIKNIVKDNNIVIFREIFLLLFGGKMKFKQVMVEISIQGNIKFIKQNRGFFFIFR